MDCIFCKITKKEVPAEIIYEDAKTIAFLDISPVHPGHALVISKQHHPTMIETPDDTACHMISVAKKVASAVIKATNAQGINFGINNGAAAGQVIFHTHYHVIPRFNNDGLRMWPQQKYQEGQMKTVAQRIVEELKNNS